MKDVLLAMDQGTADKFGPYLQKNATNLRVLTQSVPVFHNVKPSLQKFHPQIVYISLNRMKYDHVKSQDIEKEICDGIYDIKSDNFLKDIRVAIQASQKNRPEFLQKLAMLRVSDIFVSQGTAGSMDKVAPQLSKDESIKNVSQFLSGNLPSVQLSSSNDLQQASQSSVVEAGRIKQLERLLKLANTQVNYYKKQDAIQSVPRKDYDELLTRVRSLINSGVTDEKVKKIFAQVLDSKAADADKIKKLSTLVKAQNEQLVDLNTQVEQNEKRQQAEKAQIPIEKKSKAIEAPARTKYYEEESDDEDYEDDYDEEYEEQVNQPRRESSPKVHRKPRTSAKTKKSNGSYPFVKVLKIGLVLLLIVGGLVGGMKFMGGFGNSAKSEQSSTPSFNSLLKKGEYVKAAKYYNSRGVEAENKMLSDPDIKNKGDIANGIAQYNSSDAIKFDTNYFNQDYSSAASIYNASTDTNLTKLIKARRIMVSYALMKDGQIAKAKSIAEPLKSEQLNKRIEIYGKFYHANQILEAKIKHGHLSDSEVKKAKKQISDNQAEMDKL